MAVNVMLFFGIFWTGTLRNEFSTRYHYYMNRGGFTTWAGASAVDKPVPFPLVKAPFLQKEGSKAVKIIDLSVFGKYVFLFSIFPFLTLTLFGQYAKQNKIFGNVIIFLIVVQIFITFYLYFEWFPRI